MDEETLRAWWWHRQGLDGGLAKCSAGAVLARTGWARSVGGVGPYLTLFTREGVTREAADAAVASLEIQELPCARGCTYVVPASDFGLALEVGERFADVSDMNAARKLGVTDAEIDKLCAAVTRALDKGPASPEEIREATGSASRSLGPEGKKKGLTTTLPLALGRLQAAGEIRRIPTDGRLDQQRYRYARWRPNPLAKFRLTGGEAAVELARRFFSWIGPATAAEFRAFSGLAVKAGQAALAPLGLVPLQDEDDRLLFPADLDALRTFRAPKRPSYSLVSSLDGLFLLRRDLASHVAPEDRKRKVVADKSRETLGGLSDLPSHAIVDRGRLVGLWEYDPDTASIAWSSFVTPDKGLLAAVGRTETYVRQQLGDARSFSLDSPKSRAPRLAALRAAGTRG